MKLRNQAINWRGSATDTWNLKRAYFATVWSVKEHDDGRTTGKWLNTDAMLYDVEFNSADGTWTQT